MKRFLNKMRTFTVAPQEGKTHLFQISSGSPEENEIFIGETSPGATVGVFIRKGGQIYNLAYDEFSQEFLEVENERLNDAYQALVDSLPTDPAPEMPVEEAL